MRGKVSDVQMTRFREYAWRHFAYHADQRMKCFNFFILLIGAITAGLCTVLAKSDTLGSPALAVFGLLLSFFACQFEKLDIRNKELVEWGREALKLLDEIEILFFKHASDASEVAVPLDITKLSLMQVDDLNKSQYISHSKVFGVVFTYCKRAGFFMMFAGLIWLAFKVKAA